MLAFLFKLTTLPSVTFAFIAIALLTTHAWGYYGRRAENSGYWLLALLAFIFGICAVIGWFFYMFG
jgi:4-amino-4-deoxy-L-arabinose transferase-like glycosyltransferase